MLAMLPPVTSPSHRLKGDAVNRRLLLSLTLVLAGLAYLEGPVAAQGNFVFVNTTEDLPTASNHCLPQQLCPLRSAIERIESDPRQGTIRACFDPSVPGAKRCSPLAKPLSIDDPGYDPVSGKWVFQFADNGLAFNLSNNATSFDFSLDIENWADAGDNKFVIDRGEASLDHAFVIESSGNAMKGFDITGGFTGAAIVVREGLLGESTANNQFGPGLAFYDIRPGVGIMIRDRKSTGGKIVGNWCGITGDDGTELRPLQDDCVQLTLGASGIQVGGPNPEDRNVFAGSTIGSGISIADGSSDNLVQGNWLGLNAAGEEAGNEGGVTIKLGSLRNRVIGNHISGNDQSGIAIYEGSVGTSIRDNWIGLRPDGETCAGNGELGIQINNNVTGTIIEQNHIACNDKGGINVRGGASTGNEMHRNLIWNNGGRAIEVVQGANGRVQPPRISQASADRVIGTAQSCRGGLVEIYSDPKGEAVKFEGELQADAATGLFIFEAVPPISNLFVSANCTDTNKNSSGMSEKVSIQGSVPTVLPTATLRPSPTPDPSGTQTSTLYNLYVPAVYKKADRS
jgi:hypothetical protein